MKKLRNAYIAKVRALRHEENSYFKKLNLGRKPCFVEPNSNKVISVKLCQPKAAALRRASRLFGENAVAYTIADDSGTFSGEGMTGAFRIVGDHAEISVFESPAGLPFFFAESRLKAFFA